MVTYHFLIVKPTVNVIIFLIIIIIHLFDFVKAFVLMLTTLRNIAVFA